MEKDSDKIFLFGDKNMIKLLEFSKELLADGTFKLSPIIFHQLYTIRAPVGHIAGSSVYPLLTNERKKHERVLEELIKILHNLIQTEIYWTSSRPLKINS